MAIKETKNKKCQQSTEELHAELIAEIEELRAKLNMLEEASAKEAKSKEELPFKPTSEKLEGTIMQNNFKLGVTFKTMTIGNGNWIELNIGENQTGWYPVIDGVIYVDPVTASLDVNARLLEALGMKTELPEALNAAMDEMLEDIESMSEEDEEEDEPPCRCKHSVFAGVPTIGDLLRSSAAAGVYTRPRHIFRLFK